MGDDREELPRSWILGKVLIGTPGFFEAENDIFNSQQFHGDMVIADVRSSVR